MPPKESVDGCGEESPKEALFPNYLLQSPKNIRVEHGYDAGVTEITGERNKAVLSPQVESAFAVVQWENTIMDEFEGLATQFNSWVPDFDIDLDLEESSARRRRRQAENTSPLPPGHYRPQLFRCNQTPKSDF